MANAALEKSAILVLGRSYKHNNISSHRCLTKALDKMTSFAACSGRKPKISHLKIFGSLCYVNVTPNLAHSCRL